MGVMNHVYVVHHFGRKVLLALVERVHCLIYPLIFLKDGAWMT